MVVERVHITASHAGGGASLSYNGMVKVESIYLIYTCAVRRSLLLFTYSMFETKREGIKS